MAFLVTADGKDEVEDIKVALADTVASQATAILPGVSCAAAHSGRKGR